MPTIITRGAGSAVGFGLFGTVAAATDPYFNYNTLLLPGNGTNGGQNNTFLDSSTNNFTITRNGNTTQGTFSPFSQTGWSNYFDGSGDNLTAPSNTAFNFTGAYTAEMWVFPPNNGDGSAFYHENSSGGFIFYMPGGYGISLGRNAVALEIVTYTYLVPNIWNHVVAVRNSSNVTSIFLNGTRIGTATLSNSYASSGSTMAIGGSAAAGYATGFISNARIVKGTAVYDPTQTSITVPTAPLTAVTNTSLLTCQSNRFVDNSSNAFTITVTGDTSVQAFSPFAPTAAYSASTVGGSGYFDGTGDYLSAAYNAVFNYSSSSPFTCEFWFYPTTGGSDSIHLAACQNGTVDANLNWLFRQTASNKVRFLMFQSNSALVVNDSTDSFQLNAWNHVVGVMTGSAIKLWLNGVYQGSVSFNGTQKVNGNITVGGWTSYAVGNISGFRYASTEIYTGTSNITVPTSPPTAVSGTQLLLNFTNAAIIDNTAKNDLETVGNAQISTSVVKYGTGSMYFDGTGDYCVTSPSAVNDLSTGNWTIEFWVYPTTAASQQTLVNLGTSASNPNGTNIWMNTSRQLVVDNTLTSQSAFSGGTLTLNTWNHVAITRVSTTTTGYINGVSVGTNSYTPNANQVVCLGYLIANGYAFNGYIDDLRITKGIARYTSNFTPPTAAFPLQ